MTHKVQGPPQGGGAPSRMNLMDISYYIGLVMLQNCPALDTLWTDSADDTHRTSPPVLSLPFYCLSRTTTIAKVRGYVILTISLPWPYIIRFFGNNPPPPRPPRGPRDPHGSPYLSLIWNLKDVSTLDLFSVLLSLDSLVTFHGGPGNPIGHPIGAWFEFLDICQP